MYHSLSYGRHEINLDGRVFRLDREDRNDSLDALEKAQVETDTLATVAWDADANQPAGEAAPPPVVDHRPNQTSIKDQKDRGTCVCFASLACLEAIVKATQGKTLNLSEQYANWLFMKEESRNQCDDGLRTTLAARYLSKAGVCRESKWRYENRAKVQTHCGGQPSAAAVADAVYGIGQYTLIDRLGLNGPSIANPAYLETLLAQGFDIVFGTNVAWGQPDANGVYDVLTDAFGNPLQSRGGHAMLIVGYDRNGPLPFFIVKNSWGTVSGVQGYYYLSYDYVRTYAKYGYVVNALRTDMPTT
jgi:C1A family cysteine protease